MTIRLSLAALAVASAFAPFSASAVDTEGEPVIVTATRTPRSESDTLASVTVITRDDIERQQAQSLTDLLAGLPGIAVANNGGLGKSSSIFLRGTESDHVLVLVDGIKMGSATLGSASIQDFPMEQIDRIEIVRGPRSGLYGSEAIGGVIQIFTKRGGGPLTPSFMVGAGSNRTYRAGAGISGGGKDAWFNANFSYLDTDGFNACSGRGAPNFAGCFTDEPDRDGYRQVAGSVRGGLRLGDHAEVDLTWLRSKGDNHYDGSFQNESETVVESVGAKLTVTPLAAWKAILSVGQSKDHSDNYKDGVFAGRFDTNRDLFSIQNDITVGRGQLVTVGYDYQRDKIGSDTPYPVTSRDNKGVYAQYQGSYGAQEVQLALRSDDNEQFGRHGTGSVSWGYHFGPALRAFATYGTAFKAPSFNELYFPFFGNPDLKPEKARSTEIGLAGQAPFGRWSASVFQSHVDQLIAYDSSIFAPNNIDTARIRGLEATWGGRLADWDLNANLSLLDPENRSDGANRGNVLPRRAQQSLRLDADHSFGPYRVGATWLLAGHRYDDVANNRRLGGYGTVDLRAEYLVTRDWRLQARLENLLDKEYHTAAFYNQPGRGVFFTLRYQPAR
ncbi:MAG: TonB-dependent vitamin B12 receptor [Zoogloeaceae bacterium]|nr:TonB-dependent vitamin B12 receptor [Zoogloeaceae bacterium]